MREWKEYKLGDLCNRVCSGGTPSSRHSEYYDGNIPWLNTKEINFNRIYDTEKYITEDGLNNSAAKWIEKNSVIVAMYGATAGKVAIAKIPLTTNQACCNLMVNPFVADYRFVYYFLCYKFVELSSLANGGAQQNLNAQIIKDFEILLPSLTVQQQIASILSSLDDKIEVNRQINDNFYYQKFLKILMIWMITSIINDNLEQQAQALFKSWFVDFEPFKNGEFVDSELGRIPKGWKVTLLEKQCSFISRGLAPKYDEKTEELVLGQTCVRNNIVSLDNARKHRPKNKTEKWVKQWDILINSTGVGSLGRVGIVYFNKDNVAIDSHITVVRPISSVVRHYIGRNMLYRQAEIENMAIGSTGQTELPRDMVKNMPIIMPDENTLAHFNAIIEPMALDMYRNIQESYRLASLRDTLLPKLMSGELQINK